MGAERGNVVFTILMAVALLSALIAAVVQMERGAPRGVSAQQMDADISDMLSYTSVLAASLAQMTARGADPATLYSNLDTAPPSDGGFNTAPYTYKLFHPLGGGAKHMADIGGTSPPLYDFNVNPASDVTGVGPTDNTAGDILFTARVVSAAYCSRINAMVTGSSDISELLSAKFDDLFSTSPTNAVTKWADDCTPKCNNVARQCVVNSDHDAWGFYAALFPQ